MECTKESAGLSKFPQSSLFLSFSPVVLKPEYLNRIASCAKSVLTSIVIVIVINQSKLNPNSSTNQIVPS